MQSYARRVKLILFDLCGVIVTRGFQSAQGHLEQITRVSAASLESAYRNHERAFDLGKIGNDEFWRNITQELGIQVPTAMLTDAVLSSYRPVDGALSLVDRLAKNYDLALVSNFRMPWFAHLDSVFRIGSRFELVIISSEVGIVKPDPRILALAMEPFGVEAEEALLIDDSPENVLAAEQLGLASIRFICTDQCVATLQEMGLL